MARRVWEESRWADVILTHFHYQFASQAAARIARLRGVPYVVFTHGSLNRFGMEKHSWRKRLYLRMFEASNFRRSLFSAYHSEEERDYSIQFGPTEVVPNGVDPAVFANIPEAGFFRKRFPETIGKVLFLFLGRIDVGKGFDMLVPAFRQLCDESPDVHLVVAGGSEHGYQSELVKLVQYHGLQEHVTFTGVITGETKLGALKDADVFVLPSRSEGLSIAMLEAMYMGLPVIVTDRVGLFRDIDAKRCGLVVPPETDRLAQALSRMYNDSKRSEMGERGSELVRSCYTWDRIAGQLLSRVAA